MFFLLFCPDKMLEVGRRTADRWAAAAETFQIAISLHVASVMSVLSLSHGQNHHLTLEHDYLLPLCCRLSGDKVDLLRPSALCPDIAIQMHATFSVSKLKHTCIKNISVENICS